MTTACRAEHIAVGTEILLGQISNTHAQTVSFEFAKNGFNMYHHVAVGDNFARLQTELRRAGERSNVVIVTGGLGPTADDITKETLASVLHREMTLDADALHDLEDFFQHRKKAMPEENRKQALCINGGELLPNPNGTAPGQYIEAQGVHYFLLPGPPREMQPMLVQSVISRLHQLFPSQQVLRSRVLHFCGIGESTVDEQIPHLLAMQNPTVAPLAGTGEMLLRITATGATDTEVREKIAEIEGQLRQQFAPYVYGVDEDTLPSVVGHRLRAFHSHLAVAESCTGGVISSMITSVPGSSAYFRGGIVAYHDSAKQNLLHVQEETLRLHGAVSEQVAAEMAKGVQAAFGVTYGLSTTGIAGPDGGTSDKPVGLVFGAIAGPDGVDVVRMQYRGSREQIQVWSAKHMLWRLWQKLSMIRDLHTQG